MIGAQSRAMIQSDNKQFLYLRVGGVAKEFRIAANRIFVARRLAGGERAADDGAVQPGADHRGKRRGSGFLGAGKGDSIQFTAAHRYLFRHLSTSDGGLHHAASITSAVRNTIRTRLTPYTPDTTDCQTSCAKHNALHLIRHGRGSHEHRR